jgi:hypothetical protein
MGNNTNKKLSRAECDKLIDALKTRFGKNMHRHKGIEWADVQARLEDDKVSGKLWSLWQMEQTSGEPDVIGMEGKAGEYLFFDCSAESPRGRRSLCYDDVALKARKEHKPKGSAIGRAAEMGIELLTEKQYRKLQILFPFDLKTSSWVKTPAEIRKHGGAIFCDRRYNHVFMYHNGAESYYAARGFRGLLRV